jgi:hypothetical protein
MSFIKREGNNTAHALAKFATKNVIDVEYIVKYIIESGRRERRKRAETYNRLHCIE